MMWLSQYDRIFIAGYSVVARTDRSLLGWRLGVCVVRIGFVGFVMAYHATARCTQFPVTGHVAGDTADDSAFDAALGVSAGDRHRREGDYASRSKNPLHVVLRLRNSEE
jgi:hypothetical protein